MPSATTICGTPDLVDAPGQLFGLAQLGCPVPARPLQAQRQAFLPVQPVHVDVVLVAFAPQHHMHPPVTIVHAVAVDADSGLVHTVTTTAANEADVEQVADLLHGKEQHVWADSGYRGAQTRVDREGLQWHIAARPSDIAKLPEGRRKATAHKREHRKASVRAKVEHPFRVIKRQFGLMKVRFRGLAKNTAHVVTLFALSNLWMARRQLMAMAALRPRSA